MFKWVVTELFIPSQISSKLGNSANTLAWIYFQCKEWGFLLREMFGSQLGTGDYGHLTIEHVPMLMRNFLSLKEYTNQGFEVTHSLQRLLYSRSTSHDRHGSGSSSKFLCQYQPDLILHFNNHALNIHVLLFRAVNCFCYLDYWAFFALQSI